MSEASTYDAVSELRPYAIWKGAVARAVHGERVTVGIVELEPNLEVPEHQHENEQVGFVLQGRVTMVIAGEARTLDVGGTYVIPGNVPHSASTGPEGATVVDVFNPVRADWEQVERLEASPGKWPG
jgi:quercetin dioxygenase-like cupin family protein